MNRFRSKKRADLRARWMADLERFVVELDSAFAGRIPWDAAAFHFNQGSSPGLAALKIVQGEQPAGDKFPRGAVVGPNVQLTDFEDLEDKPVKDGEW